jgi:flagellar hook assembly protein FlgD
LHLEAAPNPFNPSTTLSFEIDAEPEEMAHVRVEAFDLRGRLVALLHEGLLPAGQHSVTWNAAGQSGGSGVYFLRVQVGDSSEALKLVRLE